MGTMRGSGRVGIVLLAMAFLAPCILMIAPLSASGVLAETPGEALAATQYDPSVQFQSGVLFNEYSWAIRTDPGIVDFDIGDLNGDGLKDLATISDETNSICIYNRRADGTLNPEPRRITVSGVSDMRSIAIGKLDTDGFDDIAVSYVDTGGNGQLSILFQSSNFGTEITKAVSSEPTKNVIGQFDHLGNNSVATVSMGNPLYSDEFIDIWRYPFGTPSNDRYTFQIFASPQFTKSKYLSSGDIDGDGYGDLVVGNDSGSNVLIALQPSSWKSPWGVLTKGISGQASDVMLADVVGDDKKDLIFANSQNSLIYAYRNTGTPPYFIPGSETPLQATAKLSSIAVGEFSSGSGIDILALSNSNGVSAFMRDSGGGWFAASPSLIFPVNANPIKAIVDRSVTDAEGVFVLSQGTLGRDGSIEFFYAQPRLQGNADNNVYSTGKDPTNLASGRLQNGNIVVTTTFPASSQIQIFESNTSETFLLSIPSTPLDVTFGNFDDDGNDDLAVLCSDSKVYIFPGNSLMSVTHPITSMTLAISNPQSILESDLRGNGRSDLLVTYDGGCQAIYNSHGSEPFNSTPSIEILGSGIAGLRTAIASADLDNDSYVGDIAILNQGTSKVEIYLRDNTGSIPSVYPNAPNSTLSAGGAGLIDMTIGEFGGTSNLDIAVTDVNDRVNIFLQPDYGFIIDISASSASFGVADRGAAIACGDLNDDGKDDLIIGYHSIPAVAAFLQEAAASFINAFNLTGGGSATMTIAKDIDGDLRDDITCASPLSHSLSVWYQKNLVPKAVATPSKYSEYEGLSISFTGSDSADSYSDQASLEYDWTFFPSTFENGIDVAHAYPQDGVYDVSLRVTDRGGLSNWSNLTITILDSAPTADFSYLPEIPDKGYSVHFTAASTESVDPIVSYLWTFGDGGTSSLRDPSHVYLDYGSYLVTLTVRDSDGSMSVKERTLLVSIAPVIESIQTSDGGGTFAEDQLVTFEVTTAEGPDPIVNYQWDLNFTGEFTATPLNRLVNHITYQYADSGTYVVSVRVWDHDNYGEATQSQLLVIEIIDPQPVAAFSYRNISSGTIQLDASSSYDNPSDEEGLLFSWNFDDGSGYSAWSAASILNHTFALDGIYSVKLRVMDDSNPFNETTQMIVIDRTPPVVVLSGESTRFSIGEPIQISVTVQDPNGVSYVTLHYRINNATEQTLEMTRSGGADVYVAQISPQSENCTIAYWVTAADLASNVHTTGQLVITVGLASTDALFFVLVLFAAMIVAAVLLLFVRSVVVPVDEVFIIYNDGRMMAHQTRRLKPGMDDEILSSMLVAIQGFVKDSFKDESSTHLQRLDFGEKKILVERGDSFYLAVVLHSQRAGNVPQRMQAVIDDIHREYGSSLLGWDGDLEKVRGIKDQTDKLFKNAIPMTLPGLKREREPERSGCPKCGFPVHPDTEKCASCGANLLTSTANEADSAESIEWAKD